MDDMISLLTFLELSRLRFLTQYFHSANGQNASFVPPMFAPNGTVAWNTGGKLIGLASVQAA